MYIARQKRSENIAEYILYLWQLEDMIRALEFSPDKIYTMLVEPHDELTTEEKEELFYWYMDFVNLMTGEGKREKGHLEHTLHLIADLNDLHLHLLRAPVGKEYVQQFTPLAAELPKLKAGMNGSVVAEQGSSTGTYNEMSDMEACFRALYSVVLCRLKGTATDDDADGSGSEESMVRAKATEQYIKDVLDLVSPVVAKLASMHQAAERGEIDLYKDMA